MEKIKVSVLIPAYNVGKYIGKCLDSVINQSLKEIEIIVVNDGSKDDTLEIIENYQKRDKRVILINKINEGLYSARNEGLKKANGEYILHLDGDDWIESNYLKDAYEYGVKNNLDMVVSDFYKDYGDRKDYKEDMKLKENIFISGREYIENIFDGNGYPNVWDKLVKKNIYKENHIWFKEKLFLGEDILVTIRLGYLSKKVGKLNKAYVHYMQHGNQGSSREKLSSKIIDLFIVFEELNKFFKDKIYNENKFKEYELNEVYVKFLSCLPNKSEEYNKALDKFLKGLHLIEIKNNLPLKNKLRLNILKMINNKDFVNWYLKKKNK